MSGNESLANLEKWGQLARDYEMNPTVLGARALGGMAGQQAAQNAQNAWNQLGAAAQTSALNEIRDRLAACHDSLSAIHGIADRACGIRGEQTPATPTPVPNGLLDEILEMVSSLNARLNAATSRLSRIA